MSKAKKKKLFVLALTLCLIGILATGTLAWFTTQSEKPYVFKTADSDGNGSFDFEVGLTAEQNGSNVPLRGPALTPSYETILPGDSIERTVSVYNLGDYDQWVRVQISFDEWYLISASTTSRGMTPLDLLNIDYDVWELHDPDPVVSDKVLTDDQGNELKDDNGDVLTVKVGTYTLYLKEKLNARTPENTYSADLFTTLTIPGDFDQYDMCYEDGDFCIYVLAQAIQHRNTGPTAYDAFRNCWKDPKPASK